MHVHLSTLSLSLSLCRYIASRLDLDVHTKQCRLAFSGAIVDVPCLEISARGDGSAGAKKGPSSSSTTGDGSAQGYLKRIRVYKTKTKVGKLERIEKGSETMCIASGFFKKDSDISKFIGLKVRPTGGDGGGDLEGTLVSSFGKSGKVKVAFNASIAHLLNAELELRFKK